MEQKEIISSHIFSGKSIYTKAIEVIIIALLILIPIAFYPYLLRIFNPPKELIFNFLVIAGLMFWGFKMVDEEKIKVISTPLNLPIFAFIIIGLLSLLWSNSPKVSLLELPLFLVGPLLFFIVANNISEERQINCLLYTALIVSSILGVYGILQYNGIDFYFWKANIGRHMVFGLFGNVNYFAEYLIVPLPLAISLFFTTRNRTNKILLLIGILTMGGSLILTFTRGSYLAIGISSFFMLFLYLVTRGKGFIKEHKKIFIFILSLIILATFLFALPNPLNEPGTVISKIKSRISISQLTKDTSLKRREAIWGFTTLMIKDHPILGSGLGTFKYNSLSYQAKFFNLGENRHLYPYGIADKAHNEYLQLWAELGLIGLGIFIWIIIVYFRSGIKYLKRIKDRYKQGIIIGLMGGVIAVLIDAIFGFPLHLPATICLFWLSLGVTFSIGRIETKSIVNVFGKKEKIDIPPDKKDNKKTKKSKNNLRDDSIFKWKPLLYLIIILFCTILVIITYRPFIAQVYEFLGIQAAVKRDYNTATSYFHLALKWNPYFGNIYYNLGQIVYQKGIYNKSIEYFEKAEKFIDHPNLPSKLAYLYLKKGEIEKGISYLKKAISYQEDEKDTIPLLTDLGNNYMRLKKYKLAEEAFKDALDINPDFINAHYGLAGAYLKQNLINKAQIELQKIIELAPDSPEAQYARNMLQQIAQEKLSKEEQEEEKSP